MSFRESFYQTKQLLVNRLNDFGILSANMNMGWTTLLTIGQNTRITIDVPLNLVYSDEFLITGALETSTYSRLNNKTVKLKVGNTVVDTTTTNVNGEYSFTQAPVSTGTHSFQVIFEGTNIHAASESSIITRTPNKETSVMNLKAQSTVHYGNKYFLSGTLLTDDGEYIKNASVKYYVNNSLVSTLTTDNYGVFIASTGKINSFDSLNVQFIYEGDSNYTSVSASQTIDVYQLDLRLTSDKDILSYIDNESATITAQLIDNAPTPQNLEIEDEEIIFKQWNSYTVPDLLSMPPNFTPFELLFKSSGTTFYIYGQDYNNPLQINIPSNNSSQFKLTWDGATHLSLYQDDELLTNGITSPITGEAVTSYTDVCVLFDRDNDAVVLTDIMMREVIFLDNVYTDTNGQARYTYQSQAGDNIEISANINNRLLTKTCYIQDYYRYDDASYNKISSYGSPIVYYGTGTGAWNYNDTNGYYGTISGNNEVLIPFDEITGNDYITIEFDASLNGDDTYLGIAGICAYDDNNNYCRLSCNSKKISQRISVNGSINESESDVLTTVNRYDILHYKFTIMHNQIFEEVTRGTTLIGNQAITYTLTADTKYGIALISNNNYVKNTFIKNIKISSYNGNAFNGITLTSNKDILNYNGGTNPDVATLTVQLTYNGEPALVEGETITFEVRKQSDDSLLETLSFGITDSGGVATTTFESKGYGDVYIKAIYSILVSKTYALQDCKFYDGATSNKLSQYTITRYANSFDTDHYVLQNTTNWSLNFLKLPLNDLSDFIFEIDMKVVSRNNNGNFGLLITKDSEISSNAISDNRSELMDYTANFGMAIENQLVSGHLKYNQYYTLRYTVKNDGTVKGEIIDTTNNTTVFNQTVNDSSIISYLKQAYVHSRGTTNTIYIKNIKVKPL